MFVKTFGMVRSLNFCTCLSVHSNAHVRELQDEVIELRIRDVQQQGDIQRLMAENSRLKLRLMEARSRNPVAVKSNLGLTALASVDTEAPPSSYPSSSSLQGLLDVDDLSQPSPVCERVMQRATMRSVAPKQLFTSPDIVVHENTSVEKKSRCPLCQQYESYDSDDNDYDGEVEETAKDLGSRKTSVATCTSDLHEFVAEERQVYFLGIRFPVPHFVACVLRALEESMAVIGHICFAEMPPCGPIFPELEKDFVKKINQMYRLFQELIHHAHQD